MRGTDCGRSSLRTHPGFSPSGGLATTAYLELTTGGCAANVAVDLAKLNVAVGVAGRIGRDPLGKFVREALAGHGVSCEHVSYSEKAQTSGTLVINVQGDDRRFIHAVGANAELTGLELSDAALAQARVLYVGGFGLNAALSGDNVAALFRRAKAHGVITVLDVVIGERDLARRLLPPALAQTDLFLPNLDEATALTGLADPWEQAHHFCQAGAQTVVITSGGKGAFVLHGQGKKLFAPAYPVTQIDGTGGGDAFVAGYIYGLLQQADLPRCLAYGAALGASCVQSTGATTGVFREDELREYVLRNPLPVEIILPQ